MLIVLVGVLLTYTFITYVLSIYGRDFQRTSVVDPKRYLGTHIVVMGRLFFFFFFKVIHRILLWVIYSFKQTNCVMNMYFRCFEMRSVPAEILLKRYMVIIIFYNFGQEDMGDFATQFCSATELRGRIPYVYGEAALPCCCQYTRGILPRDSVTLQNRATKSPVCSQPEWWKMMITMCSRP